MLCPPSVFHRLLGHPIWAPIFWRLFLAPPLCVRISAGPGLLEWSPPANLYIVVEPPAHPSQSLWDLNVYTIQNLNQSPFYQRANQESQHFIVFKLFRMIFWEWYLCTNIWKWMSDKENIIMSASSFSGLPRQICLNPVYLMYSKLTWTCIVNFWWIFGTQKKWLGNEIIQNQ